MRLGFAVCQPGEPFAVYRITSEGRRFMGARGTSMTKLLPEWVSLTCGGRGAIAFDLHNVEHVGLMCRMLAHGYRVRVEKP
jgi:hypothetical protein